MANTGVSHGEVKSIEDGLEISPSAKQASSAIYNSGSQPTAAKHSPKHKSGATGSESGFGEKGKAKRRNMAVKP